VDWAAARAFLRRRIGAALQSGDGATLDDLAQDALVRLLRAVRREGARNLPGLMAMIARRTATDHIRAKIRWKLFQQALSRLAPSPSGALPSPEIGDPLHNLRFLVLEFFRGGTLCAELARAYFEEQKWEGVASHLGRSHEAVRQQWSRCLGRLRAAAQRDPDFLWRPTSVEDRDA